MNTLKVNRLTYTYPGTTTPALRSIDAEVVSGAPLLVAGANGAGKSTLLAAMGGFAPHFFHGTMEGDVVLDDRSMRQTPLAEWITRVGLVFPDPFNQITGARLTVFEEVAFGLENLGVPPDEIRARVERILETMGLRDLAKRSPYALSGGQQQRVAIASILVLEPAVLALDEPTSQLDPEGTRDVFGVLAALASAGHVVAVATHRIEAAHAVVASALVLQEGTVAHYGPAQTVFAAPDLPKLGVTPPLITRVKHDRRPAGDRNIELGVTEEALRLSDSVTVTVDDVAYRYPSGVEALRGVSVEAKPGQIVALVGPNGAGKTTLSKMFNGLLRPDAGHVQAGDWDASDRSVAQLARRVGYVFQNPADQLFKRTVRDEIAFGPRNLGFAEETVRTSVEQALSLCNLADVADEHPYDLLASRRRWVSIASVLAMQTPVILLDEPTGGFDRFDVRRLHALLTALRAAGRTLVIISHDMDFVAEVADRVVVMAAGRILAAGTPVQILTDDAVLAQAGLESPPAVQVSRTLALPSTVVTETALFAMLAEMNSQNHTSDI